MTKDHTAARRLIEEGEIPDCDVEQLCSIMRSLDGVIIADYAADDFPVDASTVRLTVGDGLLLCTDGVIDALPRNVRHWWGEDKVSDHALRLCNRESAERTMRRLLCYSPPVDVLSLAYGKFLGSAIQWARCARTTGYA